MSVHGVIEDKSSGERPAQEEDENAEAVSETGPETGAVDDLSSGGGEKGWVTPSDRGQDEDIPACPFTIAEEPSRGGLPVNALSWRDESRPQWVRVRSVMVSGAAQSVAPPTMAP